MDLLDSILNGMEKPPTLKKPEIKDKAKREKMEKLAKQREDAIKKQKEMITKFRNDLAKRVKNFVDEPVTDELKTIKMELQPMNKFYRTIVHEVCDDYEQDLIVHSFGIEDEDRHCIIWKRGYEPCDNEIRSMKLGVEYNPDKKPEEPEEKTNTPSMSKQKIEKLIGNSSLSVESAITPKPGKQYGFVPVANKKDLRSIEQIIDDKRKSKKQKTSDEPSCSKEEDK